MHRRRGTSRCTPPSCMHHGATRLVRCISGAHTCTRMPARATLLLVVLSARNNKGEKLRASARAKGKGINYCRASPVKICKLNSARDGYFLCGLLFRKKCGDHARLWLQPIDFNLLAGISFFFEQPGEWLITRGEIFKSREKLGISYGARWCCRNDAIDFLSFSFSYMWQRNLRNNATFLLTCKLCEHGEYWTIDWVNFYRSFFEKMNIFPKTLSLLHFRNQFSTLKKKRKIKRFVADEVL